MTIRNTLAVIKLTAIVFVSATIVFAVKWNESQNQNIKLLKSIQLDKKTYTNDLKEIFDRYDAEVSKNKMLSESNGVKRQNETSEDVLNSDQKIDNFSNSLENKKTLHRVDSLDEALKDQADQNKLLSNQVSVLLAKNRDLLRLNVNNESVLAISKNLTAVNVSANGVKIVTNNIIETKHFSNTEQIKVCFTLLENKAAVKGNKDIYIQIINPKNKVVSKNGEFVESGNRLLHYSARTNVFYDNDEVGVCVFVDPNKTDLLKGDYELNIFSGINIIGNTVFSLK
ncbi:MAG: hypothetical protein ABI426_08845 [Flavobacterium sp.]